MRTAIATLLTALACMASANARDLSGAWVARAQGDMFALDLHVRGNAVCGRLMATSHGAAHIDESHVVGRLRGNSADLLLGSREAGGPEDRANATVTLSGTTLRWKLTQQIDGSDVWLEARLRPAPALREHASGPLADWCRSRWAAIEQGDLARMVLAVDHPGS